MSAIFINDILALYTIWVVDFCLHSPKEVHEQLPAAIGMNGYHD